MSEPNTEKTRYLYCEISGDTSENTNPWSNNHLETKCKGGWELHQIIFRDDLHHRGPGDSIALRRPVYVLRRPVDPYVEQLKGELQTAENATTDIEEELHAVKEQLGDHQKEVRRLKDTLSATVEDRDRARETEKSVTERLMRLEGDLAKAKKYFGAREFEKAIEQT